MCHNGMAPRESLETEMEEEAWFPVAQYVCHEEGSRSRSEWFRVGHSSKIFGSQPPRESPGVLLKKDPSINMGKARFELAKDNPLGLQPSAFDRLAISPCIGVCGLRESNPHFLVGSQGDYHYLKPASNDVAGMSPRL